LLADQLPEVRKTFEGAIGGGCEDPVIQFFNLQEPESLEVAAEIFGRKLKARPDAWGGRSDVISSCHCAMTRRDAAEWLSQFPVLASVGRSLSEQQDDETIRCVVFDGLEVAVIDVQRRGPTAPPDDYTVGAHQVGG
jgi:hypothetical protein